MVIWWSQKTYWVCKGQVHLHPASGAAECPDGNGLPSPTEEIRQAASSQPSQTVEMHFNLEVSCAVVTPL